jgi:hypothetical protein
MNDCSTTHMWKALREEGASQGRYTLIYPRLFNARSLSLTKCEPDFRMARRLKRP